MSPDLEAINKIIEREKFVTSEPGLTVEQSIDALKAKYDNDVKLSESIYNNPNFEYDKSFELLKASRDRHKGMPEQFFRDADRILVEHADLFERLKRYDENEPEFNFVYEYERMKQHAESPTIFMPTGLNREEKMQWLMEYEPYDRDKFKEEAQRTLIEQETLIERLKCFEGIVSKLDADPRCTQEWLLERLREKFGDNE